MFSSSHGLDAFFSPRRIAIIGASEHGMYPSGILRNLLTYSYKGEIFPVNPNRETVFGLKTYPDITQIPESIDLAIIVVPRNAVLPSLQQCIKKGVPAAVVITAGFAEADDAGKLLQAKIGELVHQNPIRILGPNCAGLADMHTRAISTRLPGPPYTGDVSFISQSGALMMALYGLFTDRQIGMNRILSLGNQVDLNLSESIAFLAKDERTKVIGTFVEGVKDGRAFANALKDSLLAGKPLVLLKSGRTETGQAAAATHTAALAGSAKVFDAVCQQFGVIQVNDIDEMLDTLQLAAAVGDQLRGMEKIALVSQSGGLGSLSADLVDTFGLSAPPLSETLEKALRELPFIPDFANLGNPSDVRGASVIGAATTQTLIPFLKDPETDVVILLLAKSSVREQDEATANAIVAAAESSSKPLCVVWVGQRHPVDKPNWESGHEILRKAGIPLFTQPSDAIKALAHLNKYWQFRERWLAELAELSKNERKPLVEYSNTGEALSYIENMALFKKYHIPIVPEKFVETTAEALIAAKEIGFPVALKAISREITHKSDIGLVELNISTIDEMKQAAESILENLTGDEFEGFQVQKMLQGGVEVILGINTDPQFGPMLALGPGGILVELLNDVALLMPPISRAKALDMIRQTKIWALLQGFRGSPPMDVDALVDLLVELSNLAVEEEGNIASLDLNPVIVLPAGQGAYAVDFRIFR